MSLIGEDGSVGCSKSVEVSGVIRGIGSLEFWRPCLAEELRQYVELVRPLTGINANRQAGGPNNIRYGHHDPANKMEFAMHLTLRLLAVVAFSAFLVTVSLAQSGTATGGHEPSSAPGKGTAVSPEGGTSRSKQTTPVKSKRAEPPQPAFGGKEFWDSDAASQLK